jgi:uncharacterized membrane protein
LASEPTKDSKKNAYQVVKAIEVQNLGLAATVPGAKEQLVKVRILEGENKGLETFINNFVPENQAYAIEAKPGKQYLISLDGTDKSQIYLVDHYREPLIYGLMVLFCVLLIALGGMQGVKALLSLILTGLSVYYFLLPAIKAGLNPILIAVLIAAFSTATTMILIAGFTKKSLAATIGTTGGVLVAGVLAYFIIKLAPLSGLASDEARILLANSKRHFDTMLNFQGVLAAGILISSLGAAMDVAISVASSAQEIFGADETQSRKQLFRHTMNVGKDIMGTMTNTLILAYTGASIPLFLLLYQQPGLKLINMEVIATELTSALCGSIGLLGAIPLTAVTSVFLLKKRPA